MIVNFCLEFKSERASKNGRKKKKGRRRTEESEKKKKTSTEGQVHGQVHGAYGTCEFWVCGASGLVIKKRKTSRTGSVFFSSLTYARHAQEFFF